MKVSGYSYSSPLFAETAAIMWKTISTIVTRGITISGIKIKIPKVISARIHDAVLIAHRVKLKLKARRDASFVNP